MSGFCSPRGGEDIDDALRCHGAGDDLTYGVFEFLLWSRLGSDPLREDGLYVLKEAHVVPDAHSIRHWGRQARRHGIGHVLLE